MNAAFGPFLEFGDDVLGDENDLGGAANELVLLGVGLGSDEGENGGAVGRGDGDEAVAGLKLGVVGEVETELIEVKAETAIEIANEDVDAVDAEVRAGLEGGRGSGHGRDYKASGWDAEFCWMKGMGRERGEETGRAARTPRGATCYDLRWLGANLKRQQRK